MNPLLMVHFSAGTSFAGFGLVNNRVLNYASTHGLAAVKSAEVSWPIADDPGLNPLLARNALKRKGTGASNRGGHRNYRGSAHSASTDHQGCGQPRRSIHRRAER